MLLVNSQIRYNMNRNPLNKKMSLYDFRLQVIEELLPPKERQPCKRRFEPEQESTHYIAKYE